LFAEFRVMSTLIRCHNFGRHVTSLTSRRRLMFSLIKAFFYYLHAMYRVKYKQNIAYINNIKESKEMQTTKKTLFIKTTTWLCGSTVSPLYKTDPLQRQVLYVTSVIFNMYMQIMYKCLPPPPTQLSSRCLK
jgi:hypothetical protein